MENQAIVIAAAVLGGAAGIAAAIGFLAARVAVLAVRLEARAAPNLFVEDVAFVPYARVSYGELQSGQWGHLPLTFPSATAGLWDVFTARYPAEVRLRGRLLLRNGGGSALPVLVKYRCFLRGEPVGEGVYHSFNPVAAGQSVSVPFGLSLPLTTPGIGVGDAVLAVGVDGFGEAKRFVFWYDSSANEWRQDSAGLDPEVLARVSRA